MRLFVSIDLPDDLADAVADLQSEFAAAEGLKLTDPKQAHVTLKFLGDVDEDQLPEVRDAISRAVSNAEVDPFDATYGGLGVFPSMDYISVVWFGVSDGGEEMTTLHEHLESQLTDIGFDPEEHDFTPHVTLARMNDARGKEHVQQVVREQEPTVGSARVEEVRLTKSELGPGGPEYSTVRSFSL